MEPSARARSSRWPLPRWQGHVQLGVITAIFALAVVAWRSDQAGGTRPADVMLLYVGADDCAPCRAWRNGEGAAFLASVELAGLTYREIKSPHLTDVLNDENWPEDLRIHRSRIKPSDGVPLWLVLADRKVVQQEFGASAWRDRILPGIKRLLTRRPS